MYFKKISDTFPGMASYDLNDSENNDAPADYAADVKFTVNDFPSTTYKEFLGLQEKQANKAFKMSFVSRHLPFSIPLTYVPFSLVFIGF